MSAVNQRGHIADMFREIERRLRVLELTKRFMFPRYSADPSTPIDGDAWVNTTSGDARIRINGSTVALGGGGGAGIPATSVVSEQGVGQAAAVGTSTNYARENHTHGTPSFASLEKWRVE